MIDTFASSSRGNNGHGSMSSFNGLIISEAGSEFSRMRIRMEDLTGFGWTSMILKNELSLKRKMEIASMIISRTEPDHILWCLKSKPPTGKFYVWPRRVPLELMKLTINSFCPS